VWRFVIKRMAYGVFVLLGVSFFSFALVHLAGDPAVALLPLGTPPEQIESFRRQMGLDRPIAVQFLDYIADVVRGEFGLSLRHRENAMALVLERLPATLKLGAAAVALSVVASFPLGVLAAVYKGRWVDHAVRLAAVLGQATPGFWLGILLILLFGVRLGWFPVSGGEGWRSLVLPAIVVAAGPVGNLTRLLRSSVLESLAQDYVRTARSKGVPETAVVLRHALRNALIPFVTMLSMQIGHIVGGSVVAETVFAYPGMGRLAVQAITNRDLPVIQAFVLVQAAVIVAVNVALDVVYTVIDPRIRYE